VSITSLGSLQLVLTDDGGGQDSLRLAARIQTDFQQGKTYIIDILVVK
jgi:hypothetical protein